MSLRIKTASETKEADYNLGKLLNAAGGLEKVAQEMLPEYIKETRDYESFARKVLLTHNVGAEELHYINGEPYFEYEKDMDSHAAFYGDDAEIPSYQVEGEQVNVGIVTLASDDAKLNYKRLLTQKYNYLERIRQRAGQTVGKLEDGKLLNLVETVLKGEGTNAAPDNDGQIITTSDTTLKKAHLVSLKKTLSQHPIDLSAFILNQATLDDMLAWGDEDVDYVTQRELIEKGVRYSIWGNVQLIPCQIIPMTQVYAFGDKEYVGRMPILKDLTVQLTETTNKLEKGLFLFEFLGMYVASHKAVGKLMLAFENGDDKITYITPANEATAKNA
jgi:hypothetical protein